MHFTNIFVPLLAALGATATPIASPDTDVENIDGYHWTVTHYQSTDHGIHNIDNELDIHAPAHAGIPAFKAHCKGNSQKGWQKCTGDENMSYIFINTYAGGDETTEFRYKAGSKTFVGKHTVPSNILTSGFNVKPHRKH